MRRPQPALGRLLRKKVKPLRVGTEVGAWRGLTSESLLCRFPNLRLIMVDCWEIGGGHETMPKTAGELKAARWEAQFRTEFADGRREILWAESVEAARRVTDGSQDFVFIDGEHTYEEVRRDIMSWWPKVRIGGILCGHDYRGLAVPGAEFRGQVKRAVDEWASLHGLEVNAWKADIFWVRKGDV